MIDLHTHSIYSDGTETPKELVTRAVTAHLIAFAVADHDTVAGQAEAMRAGEELGMRVIPAIEMTVDFHDGHIHILGYGFDTHNRELLDALERRANQRKQNFYEKVKMANKRLKTAGRGVLNADELLENIHGSPGRPHIAYEILRKGWAKTFREAFDTYLLDYAPKTPAFAVGEAIGLIHNAGGIAVLAHPGSNEIGLRRFVKDEQEERNVFEELKAVGLDGVEAYTPAHTPSLISNYLSLARDLQLMVTGGTDWHGPSFDAPAPGEFAVPDWIMDDLIKGDKGHKQL